MPHLQRHGVRQLWSRSLWGRMRRASLCLLEGLAKCYWKWYLEGSIGSRAGGGRIHTVLYTDEDAVGVFREEAV